MKLNKNINLQNGSIKSLFWKYTLPSVAMMLIMAVYFIVDAIFIGRGVGNEALAAVNLCIPLLMISGAITMALSIGASIIISIRLSQKKYDEANNVFSLLLLINILLAVFLTILGLFFIEELAHILGANEDTFPHVIKYLSISLYFLIFFSLQNTFSSVVRNDGNPNLSFIASLASSLINIPLDYVLIFVLGWGITGAAWATGLSQVIAVGILISHFLRKSGHLRFVLPKFNAPLFKEKIKNSIPVFISNISMPAILFVMNILSEKYYGTIGLSAFAIVGSISMFLMMMFAGIAQGIQPIVSYNWGIKKYKRVHETLKISFLYTSIISLVLVGLVYIFPKILINLYIVDNLELTELTIKVLRFYILGFVFMGINLLLISYFQSIENRKIALLISLLRGVVFLILMAYLIPLFFGYVGIWFVILATEFLTLIFATIYYLKDKKSHYNTENIPIRKI